MLNSLFTVDHAGNYPGITACIGKDHSCKMNGHKPINAVLGHTMHLFQGTADGPQKWEIFKSEAQAGKRHYQDKKIKNEVSPFHPDIMLFLLPCLRQQRGKTDRSSDFCPQQFIRWLEQFQDKPAQQKSRHEITDPGMEFPYLVIESMGECAGLVRCGYDSFLLQFVLHHLRIVLGAEQSRGEEDGQHGAGHQGKEDPMPDADAGAMFLIKADRTVVIQGNLFY